AGRFVGVQVCYNTDRSVKLNGDVYHGTNGVKFNDGQAITSVGTTATAADSVAISGTATTLTGYVVGNGSNNCSASYFAKPVCVSSDPSKCQAGDQQVDPGTTVPNLNIMLDM